MPSAEILAVLADEVKEVETVIRTAVDQLSAVTEDTDFRLALDAYREQVQRIGKAAEILELRGIHLVGLNIELNLDALEPGRLSDTRMHVLKEWPRLLLEYLSKPKECIHSRLIAENLHNPAWPIPLDASTAIALEKELCISIDEIDDASFTPKRQTQASDEDIRLEPDADVNPILLDAFLTEGPQQTGQYSGIIQNFINGLGSAEDIDEARRIIHSLKGAANTVGIRGIATLAHHVEDIVEYLSDHTILPKGNVLKLLIDVADCLEMQFEILLGTGESPAQTLKVLQDVLNIANAIDSGMFVPENENHNGTDPDALCDSNNKSTDAHEDPPKYKSTGDPIPPNTAKPANDNDPHGSKIKIEPKVRVATKSIDEMLRISGEMAISRSHIQERLSHSLKSLGELRDRDDALRSRVSDLESHITTQGVAAGKKRAELAALSNISSSDAFDPLEMDQYSDLHTKVHGLVETISDLQLLNNSLSDSLSEVAMVVNQQTQLNNELHDLLMTSRMISAITLENRLQRAVRQACEKSGKAASLVIHGGDVMLDDQMVNVLVDPLQHILRNAVDHGIENSNARAQLGKTENGQIDLRFSRDGNYLQIRCQDNGAGLDLFKIYSTAITRGLISEQDRLEEHEISRLILTPGFSTSQEVTELSGRGVGMDVVNTNIKKLKGTLEIFSNPGEGTEFVIRVPISMGIAHCLAVRIDKQIFAIPTDNLDQIVHRGSNYIQLIGDKWAYRNNNQSFSVYTLGQLVDYESNVDYATSGVERPVIILNSDEGKVAIVVDQVISGRDLVIKNMGDYLGGLPGSVGASILGDGSVVPILNLIELLGRQRSKGDHLIQRQIRDDRNAESVDIQSNHILIVDDSLSVRTSLSLALEGAGYSVRAAKDGLEAVEEIEKVMPAAVLVDMEMPRMNGLELTSHIRSRYQSHSLPVIMITSRTAEKHRVRAKEAGVDHYLTKPYSEKDLFYLLKSSITKQVA